MSTNNRPADCVCNYSGHCFACIDAGLRCDGTYKGRPCRVIACADGSPCRGPMMPAGPRRAPAMPEPELVDEVAEMAGVHLHSAQNARVNSIKKQFQFVAWLV